MTKDLLISVVVPLNNEEAHVLEFFDDTIEVLRRHYRNFELILVDDGSTDRTVALVRSRLAGTANARLLVLSRHVGKQIALTAGLDHAIGDYVVLMGTSEPPSMVPKLVAKAQEGFDAVYATWTSQVRRDGGFLYRLNSSLFHWLSARVSSVELPKGATDFVILSRRVVNSIGTLKEHRRFLRMLIAHAAHTIGHIDIEVPVKPVRKVGYGERVELAIDAIIAFSDRPLRYVSVLSLGISTLLLLGAAVVVIDKIFDGRVIEGWASLMLVVILMFCVLFLFLAVIAEYISRILVESRSRPLYFVRGDHGGTTFDVEDIVEDSGRAREPRPVHSVGAP